MKPATLGTILPTKKSMELGDALYLQDLAKKRDAAKKYGLTKLGCTTPGDFGDELKYWKTPTLYAIISRSFKPLWFEVRADGDYSVKG
jgi:hypothetical protein